MSEGLRYDFEHISSTEHYRKSKGLALNPCSFECMMQPEAVMLFFRMFSFLGNDKENVGKCTKVISNVLPRMPVHLAFQISSNPAVSVFPRYRRKGTKFFFCILFL